MCTFKRQLFLFRQFQVKTDVTCLDSLDCSSGPPHKRRPACCRRAIQRLAVSNGPIRARRLGRPFPCRARSLEERIPGVREGVRPFLPRLLTFPTRRAPVGPLRVGQPPNDASAARRTTLQKKTGATAETVEAGNVRLNLELSERKEIRCIY